MEVIPIKNDFIFIFALKGVRTVLVDAGLAGGGKALLHALNAAGIKNDSISLLLITHGHTDHFGGAAEIRATTGVPVAIHAADAHYVRAGTNPPVVITSVVSQWVKKFIDEKAAKKAAACEPQVIFDGEFDLNAYGVDARVVHTPGHTAGSVSVVDGYGTAIVGDLIMGRMVNAHQPRWPFFAQDLALVRTSIRLLMDRGVQTFYASHGGPFTRKNVEKLLRDAA